MKRSIIAAMAITACLLAGCATAQASYEPAPAAEVDFKRVHDLYFDHHEPSGFVRVAQEMDGKAALAAQQADVAEETAEPEWEAVYYDEAAYVPSQPAEVRGNPDGLNSFDGV